MNRNLNDKLQEVYEFTVEYIEGNGFPPSVREICAKCRIKSTASAYVYLEKLREMGLLVKSPLKKRAISVAGKQNNCSNVPLIGTISAGTPIFAVENLEGYIPLPSDFGSENSFALKVKGDSMINAGIFENDLIIVDKSDFVENGEIVVALIDDSATVKRFFKRDGKIILHPENNLMEDIVLDFENVKIIGKVKGLLRKFK